MTNTCVGFLRRLAKARRFVPLLSFGLSVLGVPAARAVTYNVSTLAQFTSALSSVQPGDTIQLSGSIDTSSTTLTTTRSGTASAPITITGDGTAVIQSKASYGMEILHDYYRLSHFKIQGVAGTTGSSPGKGLVITGASHGIVDDVHVRYVDQEAFKLRDSSQFWLFTFCSARDTGLSGDFGEGFYTGQAASNWTGGVPDQCAFVTFFGCYTTNTVNDGWDVKEGAHHVKMVNCTADFSGSVEPTNGATHGSDGWYMRGDHIQVVKCSVNQLDNGEAGYRFSNQTVNSVDYGSSGNEIKQSSVVSGNGAVLFSEGGTNGKLYTDCIAGPGGLIDSGTSAGSYTQPAPSSFVELTWSGEGGSAYGNVDSSIGADDPLLTSPPPTVAAPTFNPAGGSYTSAQSVAIATATTGASIRYTTNGTTPTSTTGTLYSGPVAISATTTLKAIAYKSGSNDSSVSSATYTISTPQVVAPSFSPAGGTFTSAQSVTITSVTSGASIRYTTDGSTPTSTTGTLYSSPVAINATTTLKAIAFKSGSTDSTVTSATYTISVPSQVAAPTFSPAGGTYTSAQSVTIATTTSGSTIRYTTDGSTPSNTAGTVYTGPVAIGATVTLKAIAYQTGMTNSTVTSAVYTINTGNTVVATSGGPFVNTAFAAQTGTFTVTYTATVSASPLDALVGFSNGTQVAYAGLATAVRFSPTGVIDARNGGAYAAASSIPYSANTAYNFRVVVNVATHTYSAFVTPPGGSEITIGSNFAFRTEQNTVASLNNWAAAVNTSPTGSLTVSNFTLTTAVSQVATPTFSPGGGTFTSAQNVTIATSTSGATIRYTTDGSTPTATTGTVYSAPVAVSATTTLKAIAIKSGMTDSAVATAAYTINSGSTTLLSDDFNAGTTGAAPAGWTMSVPSGTTATVQAFPSGTDKSLQFTDTSTANYSSASHTFTAQTGAVTLQFSFYATADWCRFFLQSGSTVAVEMYTKAGQIIYRDSAGADVNIAPFTANTWTTVKIVANASTDKFDVYVGGVLKSSGLGFRTATANLDRVLFSSGGSSTGTNYVDSVLVTN
jgi:hypothetical protein